MPVLHGKNGEDGTVQGLLELAGITHAKASQEYKQSGVLNIHLSIHLMRLIEYVKFLLCGKS